MEIIYRAFDGMEFLTKDACEQYERNNAGLKGVSMWDFRGEATNETGNAYFVHLENGEDSAKVFIAMSENDDGYHAGIEYGYSGWFYWSECDECYVYMESEIILAFAKAVNEYENTK